MERACVRSRVQMQGLFPSPVSVLSVEKHLSQDREIDANLEAAANEELGGSRSEDKVRRLEDVAARPH